MPELLSPEALSAIALTLKLAGLTTVLLLLLATPLAWWLSQTRSAWRGPIAALVTLPLVCRRLCWAFTCWWPWGRMGLWGS